MDLVVVPAERCNVSYFAEKDSKLEFGILPDDMICAVTSQGDKDKDACGVRCSYIILISTIYDLIYFIFSG